MALLLVAATAMGNFRPLGYWLLVAPAFILGYLLVLHRKIVANETVCLLVADGTLVLMGIVAFLWAWPSA